MSWRYNYDGEQCTYSNNNLIKFSAYSISLDSGTVLQKLNSILPRDVSSINVFIMIMQCAV